MSDSSSLASHDSVKSYAHEWIEALKGDVPEGAVEGGYYAGEKETTPLYVARGFFKERLLAGCLDPRNGCCYVTWDGHVGKLTAYEVLCNANTRWVPDTNLTTGAEDLLCFSSKKIDDIRFLAFPARANYKKSLIIGCYYNENPAMHIVYQEKALELKKFEMLQFV